MAVTHEAVTKAEEKMKKSIIALGNEFATIRAGRANPQLLNKVLVNYYGTPTPLPQVGNISVPEPRMLTISLWDTSLMKEVEKAILASDLGLNPSNDGKVVRLVFPEPTAERRQDLVKQARKSAEEAKVAIRNIRRDAIEAIRKDKKANLITEDDVTLSGKEMSGYHKRIYQTGRCFVERKRKARSWRSDGYRFGLGGLRMRPPVFWNRRACRYAWFLMWASGKNLLHRICG